MIRPKYLLKYQTVPLITFNMSVVRGSSSNIKINISNE